MCGVQLQAAAAAAVLVKSAELHSLCDIQIHQKMCDILKRPSL